MGIVDILSRRPKPASVRRHYDKVREKVDRMPRIEKRIELLRMLDQIEPQVIMMEEHHMSNFELRKTGDFIKFNLKRVEYLIKEEKLKNKELRR